MNINNAMMDYFEKRTKKHVDCLNKYAQKVGYTFPNHDKDKFEKDLYEPYVLMTWCTFRKQAIPTEDLPKVKYVMAKHYSNNKHHPEHWENIEDMDTESLVEMCADWCAMSEEFKNDPFDWADNTVDSRFLFNETQTYFIYKTLERMWGKK